MTDVLFAVLPGLVLLDLAGPAEAFRIADRKIPGSYRLRFIAPAESVRAAVGLQLGALEPLPSSVDRDAMIVLTGVSGTSVDLAEPCTAQLIEWLRSGVATR